MLRGRSQPRRFFDSSMLTKLLACPSPKSNVTWRNMVQMNCQPKKENPFLKWSKNNLKICLSEFFSLLLASLLFLPFLKTLMKEWVFFWNFKNYYFFISFSESLKQIKTQKRYYRLRRTICHSPHPHRQRHCRYLARKECWRRYWSIEGIRTRNG